MLAVFDLKSNKIFQMRFSDVSDDCNEVYCANMVVVIIFVLDVLKYLQD